MSQRRQTSSILSKGASVRFADRLLAESVRALEHDGAASIDEPKAERSAIAGGGEFERRIILRAGNLSIAGEMRAAMRQVDRATVTIVAVLVVLALAAGAGAGRALLDVDRETPVNFFRLLGALVGVQTVLLLAWFIVMLLKPAALATGSLGALALGGARWLAARLNKGPAHVAAIEANGIVLSRSPIGRWMLGVISHGRRRFLPPRRTHRLHGRSRSDRRLWVSRRLQRSKSPRRDGPSLIAQQPNRRKVHGPDC